MKNKKYLLHICKIVYFHIKLIEYKIERKIPLTTCEKNFLNLLLNKENYLVELERIDYNE